MTKIILKWYLESTLSTRVKWGWFWLLFFFAAIVLVPMTVSEYTLVMATDFLILCLFAVAFNLLMGFGGMVSFGHAAFFAIGAYSAALLFVKLKVSMPLALASGPVAASLMALFFGFFVVKLTSVYFSMLSLAFAQIIYTLINKLYEITGGDSGIQGLDPSDYVDSPTKYYYLTFLVVAASCGIMYRVVKSPYGFALRAVKENRKRAQFVGLNIRRIQHIAFIISGFFSGLAGSLYAFHVNSVDPSWASFTKSFEPLLATLIGGVGIFGGPFVGAFIFKILETTTTMRWPTHWPMVMGSVLVLITLFWWSGVIGMLQDPRWQKWLWVPWLYSLRIVNDFKWQVKEWKYKWKQK